MRIDLNRRENVKRKSKTRLVWYLRKRYGKNRDKPRKAHEYCQFRKEEISTVYTVRVVITVVVTIRILNSTWAIRLTIIAIFVLTAV